MISQAAMYRTVLPQIGDEVFLTDGGLETTLVYLEDWDLPQFAAFVLLDCASGAASLTSYYQRYIELAQRYGTGLILESPTWRASSRWGVMLGYSEAELEDLNKRAIEQLVELRQTHSSTTPAMVISGCIGPQDDGYSPEQMMSVAEATRYHQVQASTFADTRADMLCAMTMTYVEEAVGVVHAAHDVDMPIAISFTVETDGRLPSGTLLPAAINAVDRATNNYPAYYMINCAHPTHFQKELLAPGRWKQRIAGVRANASYKSHAELDCATNLDAGDPEELGRQYAQLKELLPNLNLFGGCCGTDHRHLDAIARHCL